MSKKIKTNRFQEKLRRKQVNKSTMHNPIRIKAMTGSAADYDFSHPQQTNPTLFVYPNVYSWDRTTQEWTTATMD